MKLGIAFGGGGARGAAHVGVWSELSRLGIKPRLITGTSIGGMVGALAAAGLSAEEMGAIFRQMSPSHMYTLPGGAPSFSGNIKLEKLLEESLGRITFADLRFPLAVMTVDLISRKGVIIDEGDLVTAILATAALPLLLPPVERDGLLLVDGGILNNLPFDVARARGATYVIAVDLTHTAPYGTPSEPAPPFTGLLARVMNITRRRPMFQVLSTVADIITIQSINTRLAVSPPELLLRPRLSTIGLFDFHRWEEGIEAGKTAVREVEDELAKLNG
jgi:NTE family protein